MKPMIKMVVSVIAIIIFFTSSALSENKVDSSAVIEYEIILKDGTSIKTETCWEDGDKIFYTKYGSTIGLSKSKIKEVKEIEADSNVETIQHEDQSGIKENRKKDSNFECTRKHCPEKGICYSTKWKTRAVVEKKMRSHQYLLEQEKKAYDRICINGNGSDSYCDQIARSIISSERGLECFSKIEYDKDGKVSYLFETE